MSAATPERDTRAETLGRIAHRAYWVTLLRGEEPTDAYDDEEAEYQRAWEAAAAAVAAHVVDPTAADYDNAAEILRLRDTVTELLAAFDFNQHGWNVARITDEHLARLRARLEG